jgi:hypothetical protein
VGQLAKFADGQTAKLELANGRTKDVIAIVDACDKRADEVARQLKPKRWWHFWS